MLGAAASGLFILRTLVLFLLRFRAQSDALRTASAARLLLHQQLLADVLTHACILPCHDEVDAYIADIYL